MRFHPAVLDAILQRHPVWRGGSLAKPISVLPSGFTAPGAELPGGGWPRPALTEVLHDGSGTGGLGLILPPPGPPGMVPGWHPLNGGGRPPPWPPSLPLKGRFHVWGRAPLPGSHGAVAPAARRLGLPVHA